MGQHPDFETAGRIVVFGITAYIGLMIGATWLADRLDRRRRR